MTEQRIAYLQSHLGLLPHPEGGFYREVYRSTACVSLPVGTPRNALTTIFFLLPEGEVSRWHQVDADEVWHFYEGEPMELLSFDPVSRECRVVNLGPVAFNMQPVHVVPAGWWQAARPLGAYSLVGCTVAPGFEFSGFRMARGDNDAEALFRKKLPHLLELL